MFYRSAPPGARDRLFELPNDVRHPRVRGIEFIEVEAQTVINHVLGDGLPFNLDYQPIPAETVRSVRLLVRMGERSAPEAGRAVWGR